VVEIVAYTYDGLKAPTSICFVFNHYKIALNHFKSIKSPFSGESQFSGGLVSTKARPLALKHGVIGPTQMLSWCRGLQSCNSGSRKTLIAI
jgi:hypothetical protein